MNFKKGTLVLITTWSIFILTGYVINVWVARYFGPEVYGTYGLVMSILVCTEVVMINGLPYAVRKFVSSDSSRAYSILWTAGRMQFVVSVVLFILSFLAAPLLASFYKDDRLVLYFRIAFLDILVYGFFHLFASFQNGLKHFEKQAVLLIFYVLSKLGSIILFVTLTGSLLGAFFANVAGSILGLTLGYYLLKEKGKQPPYEKRALVCFATPSLFYFLMLTLLFSVDLWAVKFFLNDSIAGYYVASSNIAKAPYYIFLGLSATVLPTVSTDLATGSMEEVRSTIGQAFRLLLFMAIPIGLLVTVHSREIIIVLFSSDFAGGEAILAILIWGMTFLAFFSLLTTIINADNRPKVSLGMAAGAVVLDVFLNILLVPKYGAVGGAVSTTLAISTAFLIASVYVYRRFHVLLTVKSISRIGIATALLWVGSRLFPVSGMNIILLILLSLVFYGFLIVLLGEFKPEEILCLLRREERRGLSSS